MNSKSIKFFNRLKHDEVCVLTTFDYKDMTFTVSFIKNKSHAHTYSVKIINLLYENEESSVDILETIYERFLVDCEKWEKESEGNHENQI